MASNQPFPVPYYPVEFWKNRDTLNALFISVLYGERPSPRELRRYFKDRDWNYPLTDKAWIVEAHFRSEFCAAYYPIAFPSAMDCLLWFRWVLLPAVFDDTEESGARLDKSVMTGEYLDWATQADHAIEENKPEELLDKIRGLEIGSFFSGVSFGCSLAISEWLSRQGSTRKWRKALKSNEISRVNHRWRMSDQNWRQVKEMIPLFTTLSIVISWTIFCVNSSFWHT